MTALPFSQATTILMAVFLLPLLSFILTILIPQKNKQLSGWLGVVLLGLAMVLSALVFLMVWGNQTFHTRYDWFTLGTNPNVQVFTIGILANNLTVIMTLVVTVVSFLVHLFSIEYMKEDDGIKRYFSFLGLFTFSMLGIVLADNLFLIFVFWELVGLSSYLLIGFWFKKDSAVHAAKKAFIVNRIGDLGFLIGLMIFWVHFGTLDLEALQGQMSASALIGGEWVGAKGNINEIWLTIAGMGVFCGVIGKSAQFPLKVWLPDAMEGPTPVSALIHAATMVAAGVFLLARTFSLLHPDVSALIAVVGTLTAFLGGVAALRQHDIKKVLAFSTVSQLGYMVMGMGVGAYDAAMFHLLTHAAFKACLFLSAGAIIHALHQLHHETSHHFDAQDMRNMGGLRKKMPFTFAVYVIGAFALMGLPFFSGFLSKDAILTGALAWSNASGGGWKHLIPLLGFATVLLTAFYMGRQLLLVFFGDFRLGSTLKITEKVKDVPVLMKIPLVVLAFFSFSIMFSINPLDAKNGWFLQVINVPEIMVPAVKVDIGGWQSRISQLTHNYHSMVSVISIALAIAGMLMAYARFKPGSNYVKEYFNMPNARNWLEGISFNNWYLDKLYNDTFVKGVLVISEYLSWVELKVIDALINGFAVANVIVASAIGWFDRGVVDGVVGFSVSVVGRVGRFTKGVQQGKVQSYLLWAIMGMFLIVYFLIF